MAESLVRGLRTRGVDLRTAFDDGMIGQSDEEQLRWATSQGRALVSYNVADFCRLHKHFLVREESHAGLVLVPQRRYGTGEQLRGLLRLVAARSAADLTDTVVFLSAWIDESGGT